MGHLNCTEGGAGKAASDHVGRPKDCQPDEAVVLQCLLPVVRANLGALVCNYAVFEGLKQVNA